MQIVLVNLNMASLSSSSQNVMFTGKGDVDAFIAKIEVLNKLKKYEGEEAAAFIASSLEESAFNVYLRYRWKIRKILQR